MNLHGDQQSKIQDTLRHSSLINFDDSKFINYSDRFLCLLCKIQAAILSLVG